MENNSKNKDDKKHRAENSAPSLVEEIIKALDQKNEQIKRGEQQNRSDKKDNKSSSFDEWSVSWP